MRKSVLGLLVVSLALVGAAPSRTQTYTAGTVIDPADVTENEDNIFSYLQTGVDTIRNGTIEANDFGTGVVDAAAIATDAVTSAELATDAVGALEIAINSVALTTDTTGNYVATLADDGQSTVTVTNGSTEGGAATLRVIDVVCTGCLSETELATDSVQASEIQASAVGTSEVNDNTLTAADLAATLTFSDGDFLDLSAANVGGTSEGLRLPQAASCASGTAEGQICWDTDNALYVGTGSVAQRIDLQVFLGNFTIDTASASGTTTVVTGVGFTPKVCYFTAATESAGESSVGWSNVTTEHGWSSQYGTTAGAWQAVAGSGAILIETSAGQEFNGDVTAFGTDGFTVTYTKTGSPTGTAAVNYVCLG